MKVIGIDIDDTITKTSDEIKNYIINHKDEFEDSKKLLSNMHLILIGDKSTKDTKKFLENVLPNLIENVEIRKDAVDVLTKLKKSGYYIVLITARGDDIFLKGAEKVTRKYLDTHNIPYDKLIADSLNKKQACIDNNVDIMIDDSIRTLDKLIELNIKKLLFTTDVNKHIDTNFKRVSSWLDIYEELK